MKTRYKFRSAQLKPLLDIEARSEKGLKRPLLVCMNLSSCL